MSDLVTKLTEAAATVFENDATSLRHDPDRVRSVTLELRVSRGGAVDGDLYIQRRPKLLKRVRAN